MPESRYRSRHVGFSKLREMGRKREALACIAGLQNDDFFILCSMVAL